MLTYPNQLKPMKPAIAEVNKIMMVDGVHKNNVSKISIKHHTLESGYKNV